MDIKPYSVEVEIRAYRQIDVTAVSVEEAKLKAVALFTDDPYVDELHDWEATEVKEADTNKTLWQKRGD